MPPRNSSHNCVPASLRLPVLSCLASLALGSSAHAVDFVDDFDGIELDTTAWISTGDKSATVENSLLTWNADGGSWASGDLSSVQPYLLPAAGDTTVITWTLGTATITNEFPDVGGQSIRIQLGIHSADETNTRLEHWTNTTGGLWIDLDNIRLTEPTNAAGALRAANDTKTLSSQGDEVNGVGITDWDWQNDTREIRLELTDTSFTWFDGATELGTGNFADYGIDTEFNNGFKILALGMNFDGGQGTMSIDKIEATGAVVPTSAITSFSSNYTDPVSNENFTLSWNVDAATTALAIDNGIGDVFALTTNGAGSIEVAAPLVTEPTDLVYTMTATRDGLTENRELRLDLSPPPTPRLTDLFDDFEGTELDATTWVHRGNREFNVSQSLVNWPAGSHDWAHGEVNSVEVFPMPEPGKPTTITWTIGASEVTAPSDEVERSIRPLLGIASAFERDTYSLQHWQNTAGGIWLDVTQMSDNRTDGVAGELYTGNDTKPFESNAPQLTAFDVPDWNWQTESHQFSLVLTNTGYTWFSGENMLGGSTWEADGLDHELVNGFRILASSINYGPGRGNTSLDAIEVINGAAIGKPLVFVNVTHDPETDTTTLTWDSEPDKVYAIDASTDLASWPIDIDDGHASQGETTSYTHFEASEATYFYRVRDVTTP